MFLRVVCADVQPGARQTYIDLCTTVTIPRMVAEQACLGHHFCDAPNGKSDTVVFASVWENDKALRAFTERYMPGVSWEAVTILPWETEIVVRAVVHEAEDIHYGQLVTIWETLSKIVRQRSAPPPSPLADAQWLLVQPVLYHQAVRGRRRKDNRSLFEAILDVIFKGTDWNKGTRPPGATVPTIWRRYKEWRGDGRWELAWREYLETLETPARVTLVLSFLDCSHPPKERPPKQGAVAGGPTP